VEPDLLAQFAEAYDSAVVCAASDAISIGSSTTRVHDFVDHGREFDGMYVYEHVVEACRRIIGQPFELSTMHVRTLRPYSQAPLFKGALLKDANGILIQQPKNMQAARQIRFTNVREIADMGTILKAYIYEAIEAEKPV